MGLLYLFTAIGRTLLRRYWGPPHYILIAVYGLKTAVLDRKTCHVLFATGSVKKIVDLFRCNDILRSFCIFKKNDVCLVSIKSSYRDNDNFKITTEQIWSCSFMLQEKVLTDRTTLFCGYCLPTSSQESKGSEPYYLVPGFLSWRSG